MKKIKSISNIFTSISLAAICILSVSASEIPNEELNSINQQISNSDSDKKLPSSDMETELVFIIDKSGSMHHLSNDTIGSFNSVIDEQKNSDKKGDVYVTTVMFNNQHNKTHDRKNIKEIEHITEKDYTAQGSTALLDAVGDTINELSGNEEIKNHKFMFVIITDGYENSSKEYTTEQIKKLIESKKADNWDFIFLGANIDAVKAAGDIGISSKFARNFDASSSGLQSTYNCISNVISQVRDNKSIDLDETIIENNKK